MKCVERTIAGDAVLLALRKRGMVEDEQDIVLHHPRAAAISIGKRMNICKHCMKIGSAGQRVAHRNIFLLEIGVHFFGEPIQSGCTLIGSKAGFGIDARSTVMLLQRSGTLPGFPAVSIVGMLREHALDIQKKLHAEKRRLCLQCRLSDLLSGIKMVFRLTHGTRASCPSAGFASFGKRFDQRRRYLVVFGLRAAIGEGHRKRFGTDPRLRRRQAPPTGTDLSISLLAIRLSAFLFLARPSFRSILSGNCCSPENSPQLSEMHGTASLQSRAGSPV